MQDTIIHFNGVDVDRGEYFRPPMSLDAFRTRVQTPVSDERGRERALVDWLDPDDLSQAKWGIITHEHEDPAIRRALEPLVRRRREQAGEVRELVFTEADRAHGVEAIDAFLDRYEVPPGDVDPTEEMLPYYMVIAGSPEKIPFEFQAELDITHASGRLCFDASEGYAAYAASVVAQEERPVHRRLELALYGSDNGDRITALTSRYLVPPLAQKLKTIKPANWRLRTIPPEHATKTELIELLARPDGPAMVFTAGHGATSGKRPKEIQGALISSEWQGGPLSPDMYLAGRDVDAVHDFRGMIPFFFACFSAGTPAADCFAVPGTPGLPWPDRPLVSDLCQAMLAHPRGAPAIVAHVDQAFQYSFLWNDNILGIAHFAGFYHHLMKGRRVGHAMAPIRRRHAAALASIKRSRRRRKPMEDEDLVRWFSYQDARFYAVLGDPAVRLPSW